MRELLIAKPELYIGALDWLTPCETVHVRGSFRPRDIYDIDPKQNYINVKKSFKDYVAKASNWPVGQALIDMLPELAGNMVVEEGELPGAKGTERDGKPGFFYVYVMS
ncbi:uncharacterized protein KY384_005048 [Bacidia gigantensis]|uniref:uncharacterized protein n=1 Tax=Bacidia gigantensis TaxID=2732470 RepID=UPI001D0396D2|nr:uncharacterized protein KY384_005048 [Bacidia gigantensis]KAG8530545.1 hypothetical protein KY384_005048 [Bacidia gigantensis]